ncbi:uncharacterized protein LOC129612566 [Condylostylus longicornis]|uniref:uncharacterized protein LOC129612566 n=1 Tax=Condylostylus longicornis TaxID=2530218 RepID=UPI00244DD053|nr:uncharacterized protein LOC129612566 [Condylostylus longicornis]
MLSLKKEDQRVTREQKKRLLELMRESRGMEDRKEKEEHWQKCQDILNKMGPARKSLIQWKKIWKDMRCATKKKLLEIKRTRPGSPCPIELSREDHEIIDIVGAGSDYFEEGGEGRELMCFEYAQPNDENISLTELGNESSQIEGIKEPLEEPTIDPNQPKKIKIVLPPPPPPEDETRKVVYSSSRATNSFGMDDKVLSTLLESIASASKSQRQKRDLPDPDKLFLLSFVSSLKAVPEEYKFDLKADIINVFRKWHDKLGYDQPSTNDQGTSSDNLDSLHNLHSSQHQHQPHSSNHSTLHQENGNDHRVTRQQKRMMLQLMREAIGLDEKKEKDEHWEKCQNMLNKLGPPRKTLIQWKKIWRDMRCTTKKKLLEIKRTRPGSPCPVVLNREDHEIIEIVGAGSDYFDEIGEPSESNNYGLDVSNEDNISLAELAHKSVKTKREININEMDALDEPTIEPVQPRKIKFILPPPPPPEDETTTRKVTCNTSRATNSFGMDDKVLSTLLESISEASKAQRERRELPDPDKLFLLSFVNTLKSFPEEYKFDIKTDILNVFRKWHTKLGYKPIEKYAKPSSTNANINAITDNLSNTDSDQNLQNQTHSSSHPTINHENGNVSF